uniref:ICP0D n=1 Tax=Human herpesvirus 1 TaxID=10298 RepID=P87914_HHV1|nr:ICP0D [Human alphaherpesvirus 1]
MEPRPGASTRRPEGRPQREEPPAIFGGRRGTPDSGASGGREKREEEGSGSKGRTQTTFGCRPLSPPSSEASRGAGLCEAGGGEGELVGAD